MSARYELRDVGVFDRELGVAVVPTDGERWAEYHAWMANGNAPDAAPVAALTVDQVREDRIAAIEDLALQARKTITGRASPQEMASWTLKLQQAQAFQRGDSASAYAMIAAEAASRGVTTAEIASRILQNAHEYSLAEAQIAGASGRHKDAVRALQTLRELLAYDVSVGWSAPPPATLAPATQPRVAPIDPPA